MSDVFVWLENAWVYVATVPNKVDKGEIVAALEVLFPTLLGIAIQPMDLEE